MKNPIFVRKEFDIRDFPNVDPKICNEEYTTNTSNKKEIVKPIKIEQQPYFRKHYPTLGSCGCGVKLERSYKFCPNCGKEIDWSGWK